MFENLLIGMYDALYPVLFSLFIALLAVGLSFCAVFVFYYFSQSMKRYFFVRRSINRYCGAHMRELRRRKRVARRYARDKFKKTDEYRTVSELWSIATLKESDEEF